MRKHLLLFNLFLKTFFAILAATYFWQDPLLFVPISCIRHTWKQVVCLVLWENKASWEVSCLTVWICVMIWGLGNSSEVKGRPGKDGMGGPRSETPLFHSVSAEWPWISERLRDTSSGANSNSVSKLRLHEFGAFVLVTNLEVREDEDTQYMCCFGVEFTAVCSSTNAYLGVIKNTAVYTEGFGFMTYLISGEKTYLVTDDHRK